MTWFSYHKVEEKHLWEHRYFPRTLIHPQGKHIYVYAMIYPFSCQFSITFIPSFKCILKFWGTVFKGSRSIVCVFSVHKMVEIGKTYNIAELQAIKYMLIYWVHLKNSSHRWEWAQIYADLSIMYWTMK